MKYIVENSEAGKRADQFLQEKNSNFSRAQIQTAFKEKLVTINSTDSKQSQKLKAGDKVEITSSFFSSLEKSIELKPEKIALDIIYEDQDLLVVNKPAGMVVHPGSGNKDGTLVNALIHHSPEIKTAKASDSRESAGRPGIVHRLDKDTSGILVVAKNQKSLSYLARQLEKKQFKKEYFALVLGQPASSGEIVSDIARDKNNRKQMTVVPNGEGKNAITKYQVIATYEYKKSTTSTLKIIIPTGRTHQIRVQLKSIGYPIIGDQVYFSKESKRISDEIGTKRQLLHAGKLSFRLPSTNKFISLQSELPEDIQSTINKLSE